MSRFAKNEQVQPDEGAFRSEVKPIEGKIQKGEAGPFKQCDHSGRMDTTKKMSTKGFKNITDDCPCNKGKK